MGFRAGYLRPWRKFGLLPGCGLGIEAMPVAICKNAMLPNPTAKADDSHHQFFIYV